jgi:glycosyltransferase involved in cell wall biosynthesis
MNDLVSIIVPVFNRRSAIREALESILKQTYEHWEALVVDDGSTDGTAQVVEEYSRADSRVRLLRHGQRKGAQAARNTGIRDAQGEWIAFLDSDDQWLPCSLEVRLRALRERAVSVVHSECYVLRPESTQPDRFGVPAMRGQVYRELLRSPGPVFPSLLVSKEALSHIDYLDENLASYQEWDTAIRLAKHYCYGFVEEPTFVYDCRGTDTISKDALRNALGYERVFHKHAWAILRHAGPRALARHYQSAASWYQMAGDESAVRRCMLMALLWWPFRLGAVTRRFKQDPVRKGSG